MVLMALFDLELLKNKLIDAVEKYGFKYSLIAPKNAACHLRNSNNENSIFVFIDKEIEDFENENKKQKIIIKFQFRNEKYECNNYQEHTYYSYMYNLGSGSGRLDHDDMHKLLKQALKCHHILEEKELDNIIQNKQLTLFDFL